MFKSTGTIVYDPPRPGMKRRASGWCVALVDREITRYYRWWVDKRILNPLGIDGHGSEKKYPVPKLCQPSWNAHISIIRGEKWRLTPEQLEKFWGRYQGQKFDFWYSPEVYSPSKKPDFWMVSVKSPDMIQIRHELGLPCNWSLHLTIGRTWIWGDSDDD